MDALLGRNYFFLVGRAKAHIPGARIMFPCALPWEEEPKDRRLLQNLMAIRITPASCPIHARITRLHTISHPSHILVVLPLESLMEECICLVCPISNRCCLPTASRRRVGPPLEIQLIQQYNFKITNHLRIISSNHTPELYPESYPRIISSI